MGWKHIKKKSEREELIQTFVLRLKKEYHLSIREAQNVLALLNNAISMKHLDANDIIVIDGQIDHVKGLVYEDGMFTLSARIGSSQVKTVADVKPFELLSDRWRVLKEGGSKKVDDDGGDER